MAAKKMTIFLQLVSSFLVVFPAVLAFPLEALISLGKIKEINSNGPYIGLITVYPPEENAFFATKAFKPDSKYPYLDLSGRRFQIGIIQRTRVIYVRCGVGMVNARAATQQMLDFFNIKGIVHFGISGYTNSSLNIGDVIIPKQLLNTGLWDWLKSNATIPSGDFAALEIKNYNVPKEGSNSFGRIRYAPEEFCSVGGQPNAAQQVIWFNVTNNWLQVASTLQGLELEKCVSSRVCLKNKPKVVIGLKASTSNIFVDNAVYRDFLFQTFGVSSTDMESSAVTMTSLSKGYPVIVIRGLSDLVGAKEEKNSKDLYGPLAATNVANVVVKFLNLLPKKH